MAGWTDHITGTWADAGAIRGAGVDAAWLAVYEAMLEKYEFLGISADEYATKYRGRSLSSAADIITLIGNIVPEFCNSVAGTGVDGWDYDNDATIDNWTTTTIAAAAGLASFPAYEPGCEEDAEFIYSLYQVLNLMQHIKYSDNIDLTTVEDSKDSRTSGIVAGYAAALAAVNGASWLPAAGGTSANLEARQTMSIGSGNYVLTQFRGQYTLSGWPTTVDHKWRMFNPVFYTGTFVPDNEYTGYGNYDFVKTGEGLTYSTSASHSVSAGNANYSVPDQVTSGSYGWFLLGDGTPPIYSKVSQMILQWNFDYQTV